MDEHGRLKDLGTNNVDSFFFFFECFELAPFG